MTSLRRIESRNFRLGNGIPETPFERIGTRGLNALRRNLVFTFRLLHVSGTGTIAERFRFRLSRGMRDGVRLTRLVFFGERGFERAEHGAETTLTCHLESSSSLAAGDAKIGEQVVSDNDCNHGGDIGIDKPSSETGEYTVSD